MRLKPALLILALGVVAAPGHAADGAAVRGASKGTPPGGARAGDPLANLEVYEQRRYRIDMQDCEKQTGADRTVCQRSVRNKAAAKSRRRGAAQLSPPTAP